MKSRVQWPVLFVLLMIAAGLRYWDFPARYQVLSVDELPYTQGSLELLEGMTPAYKYAPAGPQTWLGWGYSGVLSAKYLVHPTAEERAVPMQIRPFVAVNHALFDLYRDISGLRRFIVIVSDVLSVLAVAAAFAAGVRISGLAGGILLGGLFAAAPLMIDFAEQARSFSMGWSFAIIAIYFAVCYRPKAALWWSAIFIGLSIAQRVDMLVLVPLVWIEFWYTRRASRMVLQLPNPAVPAVDTVPATDTTPAVAAAPAVVVKLPNLFVSLLQHACIIAATTLLTAPWLVTNLIGNLRTIATVRFAPPPAPIPLKVTLLEFARDQGLGVVAVLFIAGTLYGLVRWQLRRKLLCLYALLMLPVVLKPTGHGIGHQAASILALFIAAPAAVAVFARWPRVMWGMVLAAVLFPLAMAARAINQQVKSYVPDQATAWVEAHVPSGTLVMICPQFHEPLPTPQRADELWQEEMNNDAAGKKFSAGLARFHLDHFDPPRALSEENMIVERVERRGWYILGSRSSLPDPRYNIHLYGQSMVFGSLDPLPEYQKVGGVLVWRGEPIPGLPAPVKSWTGPDGSGTLIYCSDDVRPKLIP